MDAIAEREIIDALSGRSTHSTSTSSSSSNSRTGSAVGELSSVGSGSSSYIPAGPQHTSTDEEERAVVAHNVQVRTNVTLYDGLSIDLQLAFVQYYLFAK